MVSLCGLPSLVRLSSPAEGLYSHPSFHHLCAHVGYVLICACGLEPISACMHERERREKQTSKSLCLSPSVLISPCQSPPSPIPLPLAGTGEGKLAANMAGGVGSRSLEQPPYVPGQVCLCMCVERARVPGAWALLPFCRCACVCDDNACCDDAHAMCTRTPCVRVRLCTRALVLVFLYRCV